MNNVFLWHSNSTGLITMSHPKGAAFKDDLALQKHPLRKLFADCVANSHLFKWGETTSLSQSYCLGRDMQQSHSRQFFIHKMITSVRCIAILQKFVTMHQTFENPLDSEMFIQDSAHSHSIERLFFFLHEEWRTHVFCIGESEIALEDP